MVYNKEVLSQIKRKMRTGTPGCPHVCHTCDRVHMQTCTCTHTHDHVHTYTHASTHMHPFKVPALDVVAHLNLRTREEEAEGLWVLGHTELYSKTDCKQNRNGLYYGLCVKCDGTFGCQMGVIFWEIVRLLRGLVKGSGSWEIYPEIYTPRGFLSCVN